MIHPGRSKSTDQKLQICPDESALINGFRTSVAAVAKVYLNGERLANLWTPPDRADVSAFLVAGENRPVVEVSNTAVNGLIGEKRFSIVASWLADRGNGRVPDQPVPYWVRGQAGRPGKRTAFVT